MNLLTAKNQVNQNVLQRCLKIPIVFFQHYFTIIYCTLLYCTVLCCILSKYWCFHFTRLHCTALPVFTTHCHIFSEFLRKYRTFVPSSAQPRNSKISRKFQNLFLLHWKKCFLDMLALARHLYPCLNVKFVCFTQQGLCPRLQVEMSVYLSVCLSV